MEFVRNANGDVEKVLSRYKNGLVASSEGIVKYKRSLGVTTITFIDSTLKRSLGNSDAQDHYEVKLVNDRVVERTSWTDAVQTKYEYDTSGNKIKAIAKHNNDAPVVTRWRWTELPNFNETKQLQKFLTQSMGDLYWFTRSKQFDFAELINVSPATGNALRDSDTDMIMNIGFIGYSYYEKGGDGFSWGKATGTYIEYYRYRP